MELWQHYITMEFALTPLRRSRRGLLQTCGARLRHEYYEEKRQRSRLTT